jgi:hypothetical protein
MIKIPVFTIKPLLNSFYIEQTGTENVSLKKYFQFAKSEHRVKKSMKQPIKWVFFDHNGTKFPVMIGGEGSEKIILTGDLRFKKAIIDKGLEYWKRELLDILREEKSLAEIQYPGIMVKSLPGNVQDLLVKAKGFPAGTVRKWSGKEYKKMSSGKWVRTYSEERSRGAQQAIRNVRKKIMEASTMEELVEIVKQNASRFQDKDGKMLPTVKEFLTAARGTEPGTKQVRGKDKQKRKERSDKGFKRKEQFPNGSFQMDADDAESLVESLKETPIDGIDYYYEDNNGDVTFFAEIKKDGFTETSVVNPFDILESGAQSADDVVSVKNDDIKPETPKTDYDKKEKEIEEKHKDIKPGTEPATGEKAQAAIEEANPSNRIEKTLEVAGTADEFKTEEETLASENVKKSKPVPITTSKTFNTLNEGEVKGVLKGTDYTGMDQREVLLTSYKSIKAAGEDWRSIKPDWIPDIDYAEFSRGQNTLLFDKIGEDQYLVPLSQKYKPHGTKRRYRYSNATEWTEEKADSINSEYAVLTLSQLAGTQDFFRKVSKSLNDIAYEEKVQRYRDRGYSGKVTKPRIKIMSENRMSYDTAFFIQESRGISGGYANDKRVWEVYKENRSALKQKTIDLDLMQEEVENTFSKGRETAYGDSNTSKSLEPEFGVKIKRQDGSDISPEDAQYLSDAMNSIQQTFGQRKSMNEKFGLKLSFAKGTAMHARKAVGIFVPTQSAIGISDGKGLKKKDPLSGETIEVDYGDENFGGFVLSHEYSHMMDYYIGTKSGQWYASDKEGSTANQIASIFRENMNHTSKSDYINRTCECFARALEQYHAIETAGVEAKAFFGRYVDEPQYVNQENYEGKIKPLVEKFFKENDALLKSLEVNTTI